MKNKYKALLLLAFLLVLHSCLQEDAFLFENAKDEAAATRNMGGVDERVWLIEATMEKIDKEKPFMKNFCQRYGVPMWEYTDVYQEMEGEAAFFWVPLYHPDYPREIQAVWFFILKDGLLTYGPLERSNPHIQALEQEWMFDLLSFKAFGEENASGLVFKDPPQTRGAEYGKVGVECKEAYATIEYEGKEETVLLDIRCRDLYGWIETTESSFKNEELGGNDGSSGSGVPIVGGGNKAEKAKAIFKNENMSDETWENVEKMLDKIMQDCMGKNAYNTLKNIINSREIEKINLQFKDQESSSFDVNGTNYTITLGLKSPSNHMFHEMIHALQILIQGTVKYHDREINNEIEAHYVQYLYVKDLPEYNTSNSKFAQMYNETDRGIAIRDLNKLIKKATKTKTYEAVDSFIEEVVLDAFRKDEEYGKPNYDYDPDVKGANNFQTFNQIDC